MNLLGLICLLDLEDFWVRLASHDGKTDGCPVKPAGDKITLARLGNKLNPVKNSKPDRFSSLSQLNVSAFKNV